MQRWTRLVLGLGLMRAHAAWAAAVSSSFAFDGSSSDMAQQFRNLYDTGFEVDALSLAEIPSDIQNRLANYSLAFDDLPPLLQRALVWDTGYVVAYNDSATLATIYTPCDNTSTMADIALSLAQYTEPGCSARKCSDPADSSTTNYRSLTCTGTQISSVSLCAASDVANPYDSSMWATGGNDSLLPVPNLVRHNWTDADGDYLVYAIHMVDPEHAYESCPTNAADSAMIIPCVPYADSDSDWCRPNTGSVVESWLSMEAASRSSSSGSTSTATGSGSKESSLVSTRSAPALSSTLQSLLDAAPSYDGTSSDLAMQFLSRYAAGDVVDALTYSEAELASIQARLTPLGLKFQELDGLLQRALVWDSGYAVNSADTLIQIYTKGSKTMAEIALSSAEYEDGGCTILNCADGNGGSSNRSQECNGNQMNAMVHCAAGDFTTTGDNKAMWATGGTASDIPDPLFIRHYWEDSNTSYTVYAVHMGANANEPAWGQCTAQSGYFGAMIVPCRSYSSLTDTTDWTTPANGAVVAAWLAQVQDETKSGFRWWYALLIALAVLAILLGTGLWWWRKKRRAAADSTDGSTMMTPKDCDTLATHGYASSPSVTNGASCSDPSRPSGSAGSHNRERKSASDAIRTLKEDPVLARSRIPLDGLQFNRILAQGGFGEVWLGSYRQEPVAIKKLLSAKQQFESVEGFIEEIRLTASLNHVNVIRYVGVAWNALENLCMVIEYLALGDLQSFLEHKNVSLSWSNDKFPIALGVAHAISYLHSRRPAPLIHRDIKAKNVLLTQQIQPKLIDFGVSRDRVQETMTAGIGTPYWAAPEVLEGNRYTEQSDIYSFGILLSELDTCRTPFSDVRASGGHRMSAFQILNLVLAGRLQPEVTPDCPVSVAAIMADCLHLDPTQRPTSVQLVNRLQRSGGGQAAYS